MGDSINSETPSGTRVEAVMQSIRQRIAARLLVPGARLPSLRSCADSMRVSKSTVVEAYDRLAAEGSIQSRRGSGFYVAGQLAPLSLAELGPSLDRAVDPLWVSRQSLEAGKDVLRPGCGWLPPSWLPEGSVRRALRTLARSDLTTLTEYGSPRGLAPLRQLLARRLAEQGIVAAPDQIILTESGTQAIDLLCRFLVEPGDTVLVDDPCYFNFIALLRAHRVKVVGVPFTTSGPDLEQFSLALTQHRPSLYITNATFHNPTGAMLSPVVAHKLLKLAAEAQLTIIEDDIFADFEQEPISRLAAFDGLDRVVHVGSFSKTISSSLRCGYIAARPDWIDGLLDIKVATSLGGGHLAAEMVYQVLKDGSYRKHMDDLRERLARALGLASARLKSTGIVPWLEPRGGMFLWAELPEGCDSADIARRALQANVVLAPGNAFSPSQSAGRFLRFNAAQSQDPRIFQVLDAVLAR